MGYENSAGLGVNNHYGVRDTEDGIVGGGKVRGVGSLQEAVFYFTADDFVDNRAVVPAGGLLPAGAVVEGTTWEVTEVFDFATGAPSVAVSASATDITNRTGSLTNANSGVVGTYSTTPAGTVTAPLTVDTQFYVTLSAASAVNAGKGKAVVRYRKV